MTKEMERMYSHRGGNTRILASTLARVVFTGLLHSADNSDEPVGCPAC